MSYIVKIDNDVFATKEEALKFIEENYLVEQKDESTTGSIVERIKDAVPYNVSVKLHVQSENSYKIEVSDIDFNIDAYLNTGANNNEWWGGEFRTVEQVVNFYSWSVPIVVEILGAVRQVYDF
jgi:hypothetical protein